MQNENIENQNNAGRPGQVKPNPSRNNKTIKQGSNNDAEKRFSSENDSNRDVEIDTGSQTDGAEIDLDRSGISTSKDSGTRSFGSGESQADGVSDIKQAGSQGLQNAKGASGSKSGQQTGQQEQQQAQPQQSGEPTSGVKKDDEAMKAGAGVSYDSNAKFDEDEDYGSNVGEEEEIKKAGENRQSGTAPGSKLGKNQNANRGAQQGGQFKQNQDDSRLQ